MLSTLAERETKQFRLFNNKDSIAITVATTKDEDFLEFGYLNTNNVFVDLVNLVRGI